MYDINQRFLGFVSNGDGAIYAIQSDGVLLWYRHSGWRTGARTWSNGGGLLLGDGWQQFSTVLASQDGQLFGINADGRMRWYKRQLTDPATGAGSWHPSSGATIHTGLASYPRVFGGWGGVFYAVDDDGRLHWLRYLAGDGTAGAGSWAPDSGAVIADGWQQYYALWAEANGVIYAIRQGSGDLLWFRYLGSGGSGASQWANGGAGVVIGLGFSDSTQKTWFPGGSGVLYTVWLDGGTTPGLDHELRWFRLNDSENIVLGAPITWVNGGNPLLVGEGFTVEPTAALQGYATDLSPRVGQPQGFAVSSTFPSVEASVERLAASGATPGVVWGPVTRPGRFQLLPGQYRSLGCGWTASEFSLTIPTTWQSGVYACRLRGLLDGPQTRFDIPFVVKAAAPTAPIAVMLPTNTYSAYNTWGGHNQYTTIGQLGVQRVVTSLRPSTTTSITGEGRLSHTFYTDLLLLRWMVDNGDSFDCYQDGDLDANPTWLGQYRALVLGSHPEYWSQKMRDTVRDYLAAGGHVINTGGNAVYERMSWDAAGDAIIFRSPNGNRQLFADLNQPTRTLLGVDWEPGQFMNFAPYRVLASHPFLAGTGLAVGDTFGHDSYNFAASGWEVDRTPTPPVAGTTVIARGENGDGTQGADLVYVDKGNGGWVFSTSSITFNGALGRDAAASTILRNALTAAIA